MTCAPIPRRLAALRLAALATLPLAGAAGLASCAALGVPDRFRFRADELEAMVACQCPLERRVLEVIDLRLTGPSLTLRPDRDRVALAFDLAAEDRVFGGRASARVALELALRWDPDAHALRARDVRVERFDLAGGSSPLRGHAARLGGLVAERALDGLVLWRMPPEQVARLERLGVRPVGIDVRADAVEVRLGPAAAR